MRSSVIYRLFYLCGITKRLQVVEARTGVLEDSEVDTNAVWDLSGCP